MDERFSIGLPVGVGADMHQYNWINSTQSQRAACWTYIDKSFANTSNCQYKYTMLNNRAYRDRARSHSKISQQFMSLLLFTNSVIPLTTEYSRADITAAALLNVSVFQLWVINFLKCLKLIWIEHNSCTFRAAVRTFRSAARPACDNVRVDISTPAPGRDDVILICDSD